MKRERYTREYGGVLVSSKNYQAILDSEGKDSVDFHNKHLKAYIKGKLIFKHGKNEDGDPVFHRVEQKVSINKK